jgi:hypothetical protein
MGQPISILKNSRNPKYNLMEELFRFSVIRAVNKSLPATVSLQRAPAPPKENIRGGFNAIPPKSFQDQLRDIVNNLRNEAYPALVWSAFEPLALDFLLTHGSSILNNKLWTDLQDFLDALLALTPDLLIPAKWPTDQWNKNGKVNVVQLAKLFTAHDPKSFTVLTNYQYDLSDLFIALMIIRRGGPANIENLIRSKNPAVWNASSLLHDKPSLQEISDHINMISLIVAGPAALAAPATATTADDIQASVQKAFRVFMNQTLLLPTGIFAPFQKPVHGIGFREFHVVKQHIRGYELGEIAKIENILKGELRDHATKHTRSNETDTFSQTISTTETGNELTSNDHISIQNEAQSQLKEDTKVDAGVHASYDGGSFKLQADLTVAYEKSSDETKKYASDVSKDVTKKASTKVTNQVTQSQTTKIIETFEEDEDQAFDNKTGTAHISGVYQWVEKVYLAQTFNLGRHMLFDIMVPEPGASLLGLATVQPEGQNIPVQPDPLGTFHLDPVTQLKVLDIPLTPNVLVYDNPNDANYYGNWISKYRVTGVNPLPPFNITVAKPLAAEPGSSGDVNSSDSIQIDDGYKAVSVKIVAAWYASDGRKGDGNGQVDVQLGGKNFHFANDKAGNNWGNNYSQSITGDLDNQEKSIGVAVKTVYINQVSVDIEILCQYTDYVVAAWKLRTYEQIVTAWQKLQTNYETALTDYLIQKATIGPLGAADPDVNRLTERIELKRQAIAIIDYNNATVRGVAPNVGVQLYPPIKPKSVSDPDYPQLPETDLKLNQQLGITVRWFEQAFEWENMAYVSYPYFWGRRSSWITGLNLKNNDPLFLNFLQAGYARVVVPVRIGFEKSLHFYLHCGLPWIGGALPCIGDLSQRPLYLDIAEEIKDLTGGNNQESEDPIGQPWEIKIPTTLIKLRPDDKVPSWTRIGPDQKPDDKNFPTDPPIGPWTWSEDPDPRILPYVTS